MDAAKQTAKSIRNRRAGARRGGTLLMCLFTMVFTSIILMGLIDSVRLQVQEQESTQAYEKANYLAGAAVHHCCAMLQQDMNWRTGVPMTAFPPGSGDVYSATVVDSPSGQVIITGVGTVGTITRTLQATIQ